MSIRTIIDYPANILRDKNEHVTVFDQSLAQLSDDMFETMYAAKGVGLAAPQVGLSIRLFVMDCDGVRLTAANPQIIFEDGEQIGIEGCLSIGRVPGELTRPLQAVLRAQDLNGHVFEKEAIGYAARCFMHETDHCNGILFIDRLDKALRENVKREFRNAQLSK